MPILAELLEPVPGEAPAGVNLRYDPVYDQIKRARYEEEDLPQGDMKAERKTADWPLVMKLAKDALTRRSKDLQIAVWLTEAKLRREGAGGLAEGLELLRELIERYWDGLYPEIEDGDLELRAGPLEWIGRYLDVPVRMVSLTRDGYHLFDYRQARALGYEKEAAGDSQKVQARQKAVAAGAFTPEEFDKSFDGTPKAWYKELVAGIDAARMALDQLQGVADSRFGDVSPNFSPLRSALDEVRALAAQLLTRKLEKEPDPVELASPPEQPAETPAEPDAGGAAAMPAGAGAAPTQAVVGGPLPAMPRDRDDAIARVAGAARFLRAQAPGDPAPYLVLRGLRWGELRAASPLDPRLLLAPPTDVRSRLKALLLDGKYAALLDAGEEVMAQPYGRGWLDLQRYTLEACEGLGSQYEAVASAIKGALRTLLRDLPELLDLTLMDDTPTANVQTRSWLAQRGLVGGEPEAAAPAAEAPSLPRGEAIQRAEGLLRSGDSQRAIQLLLRAADQEKSARARFLGRSQATRVMVEAGFEAVALPILREMVQQIEKHGLEEWEAGDTVAQPLGLLYRCLDKVGTADQEKQPLYLRICRLDPLQAMQLASSTAQNVPGA